MASLRALARLATSADACTHVDLLEDVTIPSQRRFLVDKHTKMTASKAAASAALKELDVLLTIQHMQPKASHVVALDSYRLDVKDHRLHLMLEHCARGDLFRVAQEESRLVQAGILNINRGCTTSEHSQRRLIHQLLRGVKTLHDCGIAHMDLSLENVLMTAAGDVRVADFALAQRFQCDDSGRAQPTATPTPLVIPKRAYAAPEMLVRDGERPCDLSKVDAWAVGIIMWHLLTRSPLFSAKGATVDDPMFGVIRACREIGNSSAWIDNQLPSASPALRDLLQRLLDLFPSTRLSVANALQHPWFVSTKPSASAFVRPTISIHKTLDHTSSKPSKNEIKTTRGRSRTASAEISLDATRIAIRPSLLRKQ